jgi:small subunit ribosomal protein S5
MADEEIKKEDAKEAVEEIEEIVDVEEQTKIEEKAEITAWKPKTSLGKKVKNGEITKIDQILDEGEEILEAEIVDMLLPNLESELLLIGQSKGKFGGGQRRVFKQTQKKTAEGNRPRFATYAVVGNKNGYVGLGYGKCRETVPAREKALRGAKLNIMKIKRGCGDWQCDCGEPHTVPFVVKGKCGSVEIKLMPAPRGTGLCAHREIQKILRLAGFTDIWSKTQGHVNTTTNLIKATENALKKLMSTKHDDKMKVVEGIYEKNLGAEFEAVKDIEGKGRIKWQR